jgi:hypothetical protein
MYIQQNFKERMTMTVLSAVILPIGNLPSDIMRSNTQQNDILQSDNEQNDN